jgi:hypothetical protein
MGPQGEAAGKALETAALATDGLSGAGQALSLVLELEYVKTVKARAATIAKTIVDKAAAVATKAAAAAQWAMNAAMNANPIGLVVVAVGLLIAGFVLLYRHSQTVRDGVSKIGDVGKRAFDLLKDAATATRDVVVRAFDAIIAPIQRVIDKILELIGWLKNIRLPSFGGSGGGIPGVPSARGVGAVVAAGGLTPTLSGTGTGTTGRVGAAVVNNYYITGALDPVGVADQLKRLSVNQSRLTGAPR